MIHVTRDATNKPGGFDARSKDLWKRFRTARKSDSKLTITRFWTEVRPTLRNDAHALGDVFRWKCGFCEAHMRHVSNPHIEHYKPKGKKAFQKLAFAWDNWILSCGKCDETKWAHFPDCGGVPCLLDPTSDDPEAHITFVGSTPVSSGVRGQRTIELLGLDRGALEDNRELWLSFVNAALLLLLNVASREEARQMLIWMMQPDAPYSSMTKHHLREKVPGLANPAHPHPAVTFTDPYAGLESLVQKHASALKRLT